MLWQTAFDLNYRTKQIQLTIIPLEIMKIKMREDFSKIDLLQYMLLIQNYGVFHEITSTQFIMTCCMLIVENITDPDIIQNANYLSNQ